VSGQKFKLCGKVSRSLVFYKKLRFSFINRTGSEKRESRRPLIFLYILLMTSGPDISQVEMPDRQSNALQGGLHSIKVKPDSQKSSGQLSSRRDIFIKKTLGRA